MLDKQNARKEIEKFQLCLNQSDLVPEQCYRRNHLCYSMISYVNQVTALYFSNNYDVIPIFIGRAYKEIEKENNEIKGYKNIALDYLTLISYFLYEYQMVEKVRLSLIPTDLIDKLEPKKAPE